ncbi:MAG: hypothetical protein AAF387_00480 [Pseudomonadota bacterium]
MPNALIPIFRFTAIEVMRTRIWLFGLIVVAIVYAIGQFASSLAITESLEYRIVTYVTLIRLSAVFIVALFVASSVIRDFDDGVFDFVVSRSVSRASWYGAKLAAFSVIVVIFAAICLLPLFHFGATHIWLWWYGFAAELVIVAAASLACAVTLRFTTVAVSAVIAFYVLGRVISAMVLMSERAASEIAQPVNKIIAQFVQNLAYLLPDLSRFASVKPLIDSHSATMDLSYVAIQMLVYCAFLSCIGMFDLHRRNL